jgi:hypothetical protein
MKVRVKGSKRIKWFRINFMDGHQRKRNIKTTEKTNKTHLKLRQAHIV